MLDFLLKNVPYDILRECAVQFMSNARLLICACIFFSPLQKKDHFKLRMFIVVVSCVIIIIGTSLFAVYIPSFISRFTTNIIKFCLPLLLVLATRDGSINSRLKVLCAAVAAWQIGITVFSVLLACFGKDPAQTISFFSTAHGNTTLLDWSIYFAVNIAVYCILFFLFRYNRYEELDEQSRPATLVLTIFCLAALVVPDLLRNMLRDNFTAYNILYRLDLAVISIFILLNGNEISFHSRYRSEKAVMDKVLYEERKQYSQLKESIDVINARCHDLRHQLDDFSGRLTDREIEELRSAMDFYDSNVKTGNEVLDVVIRIAQLTCQKDHIQFSCLADGACLSFMRTAHIYSLFNNAVSNAIEAVKKISDEEKRIITLTVSSKNRNVFIETTNYFDPAQPARLGTNKEDSHHHGFGLLSMQYIIKEYGGTFAVQAVKDVFTLAATIPLPESSESAK